MMVVKKRVVRRKKKFPIVGTIVLLVGIVWFLMTLGKISDFPWIPAIITIIGIGLIFNQL